MSWIDIYKHILPRAASWKVTIDKTLKEFFFGISQFPESVELFFDNVYEDLDPKKTRQLSRWEKEFGLTNSSLTESERRTRLESTWSAVGGQSPGYIQDVLRGAGFDVYVHEWWEPIPGRPGGGSVDGDVTPVARDPRDYLDDGTGGLPFLMTDGSAGAQDGGDIAYDGATATPSGYPLVNKVLVSSSSVIGDGSQAMQDGGQSSQDGGIIFSFIEKQYVIPSDPDTFPYFLYIGGEVFPGQSFVPESRREEFENLCLKICPAEQWLGILVNYS